MPDYRRYRMPGGTYFFTINLLERRADLLVRHIEPVAGGRSDLTVYSLPPILYNLPNIVHFNPVKHGYVSVVAHCPIRPFIGG